MLASTQEAQSTTKLVTDTLMPKLGMSFMTSPGRGVARHPCRKLKVCKLPFLKTDTEQNGGAYVP
jgi:hypothetical protein